MGIRTPLARNSAVYALSNVLSRAIPFLLLPVLTRFLTPEDVGTAAMYTLAVSLLAPVIGMSTESAVGRQYVERDRIDFPNYVANCIYIAVVTAAGALVLLVPLADQVGALLSLPGSWVWTVAVVALARFLSNLVLVIWQMMQRPKSYGIFFNSQTALALGLSVYLIVGRGYGWEGRALGEVVSVVAAAFVAVLVLVRGRWIRHGLDRDHLRHALSYGGGLLLHAYGGLMIIATDRLFITKMLGLTETGLYTTGVQIGMIIGVLEHSFNQAWAPWLFTVLKRGDLRDRVRIKRFTYLYNVVILLLAVGLGLIAPWFLGFFVGAEFQQASQFVLWLALGHAFSGMYKMVVNQIFYANKTHWLAWITFATGLANVALNFILIRVNGAVGAAQATALAFLFSYLMTAHLSRRVSREIWDAAAEGAVPLGIR